MFQLNRKAFSDTLLAVTELENSLISQRENQQNALDAYWQKNSGLTAQTLYTGYTNVLNNGVYAEAVNLAGGVRMSMEAAYPTLNRLVEQRRSLLERMGVDSSEDEDLVLDAAYKQDFISSFEEFETANYESMRALTEVMDACGGLIDFTEEREALAADYENCKWIGELGPEWQLHFKGIEDLEEGLRFDFGRYVDEEELSRECSPQLPYNMWSMFAAHPSAIKLLQHKHPDSFSEGDIQALGEEWKHAVEAGDTATMQQILEVAINAESGEIDKGLLEAIGHYAGEEGALLTELASAKDKFPRFHYVDYAVQVKKEGETYEINLIQDVFLEKDNRYTVTMNGQGLVTGEKQIVTQLHSYTPGELRRAQELVEQGEDGSYGFEEVLSRDAGDISEADYELLGAVLEDKCRMLEYGLNREGAVGEAYDVTESMLESLCMLDVEEKDPFSSKRFVTAYVQGDIEKIEMISQGVERNTQAAVFLKKLSNYRQVTEATNDAMLYDLDGKLNGERLSISCEIAAHQKGHMIQMGCEKDIGEKENYVCGEIYTISPLWAKNHMEELPASTIAHAESIGYDEEKFFEMYLLPENESDYQFIDKMIQTKYREMFRIDPDELSDSAKILLAQYGTNLVAVEDENGYLSEYQHFVNELLYQDTTYCATRDFLYGEGYYVNDYIETMAVYTGLLVQTNSMNLSMWGEGSREQIENTVNAETFWLALNDLEFREDFQDLEPGNMLLYADGKLQMCISGMQKVQASGTTYLSCNLQLCSTNNLGNYKNELFETSISWNPTAVGNTISCQKMEEINKKIETLWMEVTADTVLDVVAIAYPGVGVAAKTVVKLMEGSVSSAVSSAKSFKWNEHSIPQNGKITMSVLSSVFSYTQTLNAYEEELQIEGENTRTDWFFCLKRARLGEISENRYSTSTVGCNGYDILQGVYEWNQQGITSFVKCDLQESQNNIEYVNRGGLANEHIYDWLVDEGLLTDPEIMDAINCLVYGVNGKEDFATSYNSVLEIDGETFTICMEYINMAVQRLTNNTNVPLNYWDDKVNPEQGDIKKGEENLWPE